MVVFPVPDMYDDRIAGMKRQRSRIPDQRQVLASRCRCLGWGEFTVFVTWERGQYRIILGDVLREVPPPCWFSRQSGS